MPDFPFVTDGCSGAMTWAWQAVFRLNPPWNDLCIEHDRVYWHGGTRKARREADDALMHGVVMKGFPIFALIMWWGTRLGGHPLLPLPWRWGYGWRYPYFYDPE